MFFYSESEQTQQAQQNSIVSSGLILHIDTTNTASYSGGSTLTDLVNGYTAPVTIGVSGITRGEYGSLYFAGGRIIQFTNSPLPALSNYTINMWLKPVVSSGPRGAFTTVSQNSGETGIIIGRDVISNRQNDSFQNIVTNLPLVWQFVTLKVQGSNAYYFNNLSFLGLRTDWQAAGSTNLFAVGARYNNNTFSSYTWSGNIGKIELYNRALSNEELQQNFEASRATYGI